MFVHVRGCYRGRNCRLELPAPTPRCHGRLVVSVRVRGEVRAAIKAAKNISVRDRVTLRRVIPVHDRGSAGVGNGRDPIPLGRPRRAGSKANRLTEVGRGEPCKDKRPIGKFGRSASEYGNSTGQTISLDGQRTSGSGSGNGSVSRLSASRYPRVLTKPVARTNPACELSERVVVYRFRQFLGGVLNEGIRYVRTVGEQFLDFINREVVTLLLTDNQFFRGVEERLYAHVRACRVVRDLNIVQERKQAEPVSERLDLAFVLVVRKNGR